VLCWLFKTGNSINRPVVGFTRDTSMSLIFGLCHSAFIINRSITCAVRAPFRRTRTAVIGANVRHTFSRHSSSFGFECSGDKRHLMAAVGSTANRKQSSVSYFCSSYHRQFVLLQTLKQNTEVVDRRARREIATQTSDAAQVRHVTYN
jgi:hypothetical protein